MHLDLVALVATLISASTATRSSPAEIEAFNALCNKTFENANASGAYVFSPEVVDSGNSQLSPDVSWARSVFMNETSTQSTLWFSTGGLNYSNDFELGYDACGIQIPNITIEAQYNGRNDPGTCSALFDANCISALNSLAVARANELVTTPSSYGPDSNLTNGALPRVCDDIATTIENNFPEQCKKYWNATLGIESMVPLTDYNNTSIDGECCSDFQEVASDCTINDYNKTFYPMGESFLPGPTDYWYDQWNYQITPILTIFMPIANYLRHVTVSTTSQIVCVRTNSFSAGSRVSPPQPSPPAPAQHLSGGDIAGIVVGVVAAVAILGGVAFWFWRRKRKDRALERWTSPHQTFDEKNLQPVVEAPDSPAPTYNGSVELSPESVVRPELPTTKSHLKNELEASETHRSELP